MYRGYEKKRVYVLLATPDFFHIYNKKKTYIIILSKRFLVKRSQLSLALSLFLH